MSVCTSSDQVIGWMLLQTTAVTSIVSDRVFYGNRLPDTILPAINYFELPGSVRYRGIERPIFSINCRAEDISVAKDLASVVVDLFGGSNGMGMFGTNNGFSIARSSVVRDNGIIPEADVNIYNASVDVQLVYTKN